MADLIWSSHTSNWSGPAMKTTLNLNDQVLRHAKERAARDGVTLTRFVENALRAKLMATPRKRPGFKLQIVTVKGKRPPNVDISDRDALYDVLEEPLI
ncbi:MAG: hypothetical protein F4201_05595 [Nitrospira sp. SB0677_bin_15]|nr:hypothetical protein [Nitrospira sp. SB0661_bin_20]MYG40273.1 hypothetical protein [Nitrospira sp. SB0677_bin_15]MYH01373.1 hypothetical protein [Nitrospira sp. SB0675_bin_23]MYJ23680.1 hypothetical protein [Nitrospira sp. SB0673_bin_12]